MNLMHRFVPPPFYCSGNTKKIITAFQKYVNQLYSHKMYFLYISIITKRVMTQYPYHTTVVVMMKKFLISYRAFFPLLKCNSINHNFDSLMLGLQH